MRRPAIALLSAVLAVTAVVVPTSAEADGAPPKRIVSGWIPYWMSSPSSPGGVTSLVQNADLLTDVSPFWYSAVAKSGGGVQVKFNANFGNGAANAAWAMGQLKAAGIPVLPAIADSSGKGRMAATLANPGLRAAHVADIVNLVVSNGYDGIDLDYEGFAFTDGSSSWAATKPNWTAFIQELGAALHAQGKLLAVTIPPPCSMSGTCSQATGYWVYNMTGIAPSADRIRIMAYDYSVRGIGPLAPMPWVRAIVQYSASVMDPARLQIGVPTYGRAWTRLTSSGAYRLSGVCPTDKSSSAYRSLTGMQSPSGSTIPALLASVGATGSVEWDAEKQEYTAFYDKAVQWTDSSGASQTCTAKRVLQFLGPQGVLARTQLVGEFGLSAAAYWTIGGEDPAQWPVLRAYGQSLAPAGTDVATVGVPSAVFGTPLTFTATVGSLGAPLAGVSAVLQFRAAGTKKYIDVQAQPTAADGTVAFQVTPSGTGDWQVYVAAAGGRTEGVSAPFTTQILSQVTGTPAVVKVPKGDPVVVRARALPAIDGQSLALQIQRGTKWKNVDTAKANGKGRARLVAAPPRVKGWYTYRVVAVGKASILSGASAEIRIKIK